MKVFALFAILVLSVQAGPIAATTEEVLNMTAGILVGVCNAENLDYLSVCITDTGRIG